MSSLTCFKAYDIRGRLGIDLDEDIAYRIGCAFARALYSFYSKTRKLSWVTTRKLSDTLSRNFVHSCGMVSRMNARMASANCF